MLCSASPSLLRVYSPRRVASNRHKKTITDPCESDQGQKKREKKNCFVKVVRQPKHMEHEAQRDNVQNKSEQRRIDPGPRDNPEHEQNKKENRGQGQAPNYLEKKIGNDPERVTCGERMFENERRRSRNQVRQRKQQRNDVEESFHVSSMLPGCSLLARSFPISQL